MPEKPLTIATYAAGASLAAAALVYVFGPTYFFDQNEIKSGTLPVGLANPANDCFINCILQATAGLPDLRKYLIREVHRRTLDGEDVYVVEEWERTDAENGIGLKPWKLEGLRQGIVTKALKSILDRLNERPISRKTISAVDFIRALEVAFRTRVSRQQQDAQEFLQVVLERLCDEYHAGRRARESTRHARLPLAQAMETSEVGEGTPPQDQLSLGIEAAAIKKSDDAPPTEDGFPFEGKIESHIECETCHFEPKPSETSFVTLTLNVPQRASTTLNECFDGMLKIEHIEDYKCDRCRLEHAISLKQQEMEGCKDAMTRERLQSELLKLQRAFDDDPENAPQDVELPESKLAPKRRITRHMEISFFPKILAIHLSRSIYAQASFSFKNTAKVAFPETLPLGGLLNQRKYRLLSVVMHKGVHSSGHYETFRRQVITAPFSTPHSFGTEGVYSNRGSPNPSVVQSPQLSAQPSVRSLHNSKRDSSILLRSPKTSLKEGDLDSQSSSSLSSQSSLSLSSRRKPAPTSAPRQPDPPTPAEVPPAPSQASLPPSANPSASTFKSTSAADLVKMQKKHKKRSNKWWRISDDRITESKTSEVLGMQKEVYLLFYELDDTKDD